MSRTELLRETAAAEIDHQIARQPVIDIRVAAPMSLP